ncbi:MAG TPA: glycosyltransferase [Thermoanaerobaculia bacterium]|nr:glycosyltransferase [Thermoanaerobaculia bacterium]
MTVLLATYNDEPFLGAAIDSVLAQTFSDFELLIVLDASTDRSRDIVESYRDPRVRLLVNETNLGLAASLNRGLAIIASEYVARLDGNDLCFPERLARQVAYLDANPDVALAGSQAALIDVAGRRVGSLRRPVTSLGIRWHRVFGSPVIHSSAMFRRAIVWDTLGGYDGGFRFGEDFEVWNRLAKEHAIGNLPEALVAYRDDPSSMSGGARHPARDRYLARKAPLVYDNLTAVLRWDDVPRRWAERWVLTGDSLIPQTAEEVRDVVMMIESCTERLRSVYPEAAANEEVVAHQAGMLASALVKAPVAGRLFSLRLWTMIWRRHQKTALRALPRFAAVLLFGQSPLRLHRVLRARRAHRWRLKAMSPS